MKKIKIGILCFIATLVLVGNASENGEVIVKASEPMSVENLHLSLDSELKQAMDDYLSGKISEEVYLSICEEISKQIDTDLEYSILKSDYQKQEQITFSSSGGGIYDSPFTPQEIKLFAAHPISAAKAKSCADIASKSAQNLFRQYTLWQGNGDAYRHAYWSALMTKKISRDFAYDAGLAHEGLERGYNFDSQNDDTKMDISNNYSGRKLGTTYSSYSDSYISQKVINDCINGNLKRVRTYTSVEANCDKVIDGVMTKYVGYYVKSSKGGVK